MADLSIASAHIILLLLAVILSPSFSAENEEADGNHLCYCHNDCKEQDHNTSLTFAVMSAFLERAVSKIDQLSTRQNQIMSELDNKIQTLYEDQERAFHATMDELKTNLTTSLVQVKDQAAAVEERLVALHEQQNEADKSSGDQSKKKSRCPDRFHYDDKSNICIMTSTDKATWDEAKKRCERSGAGTQLAVLDTEDKRRFARFISAGTSTDWWVDSRRESGQFKWSTGQDIDVGAWEAGQPDGQECVDFRRSGRLGDYECAIHQKYICEFNMV